MAIDAAALENVRANYPGLLEEIGPMFRDDGLAKIAALDEADATAAKELAHSLKGMASPVGAYRLRDAAAAVERDPEAPDLRHGLVDAFHATLDELTRLAPDVMQ